MRIERTHLSAPLFIIAVGLLLLNDFYLKPAYPGLLTGKLSDVAGLFAFPFFFSILLPRQKLHIYMATAAGFIAWKLPAADAVIAAINDILPYSIGRTVDYSDYCALLIIPLAYFYKPKRALWNTRLSQTGIALVAMFAFCATAGTHGFIKSYRYNTPKYNLQRYIDTVFAHRPDFRLPKDIEGYSSTPDPYFDCYLTDTHGSEVFTVRYYGDKEYWDSNYESEIFIVYAGRSSTGVNSSKDLSPEEKTRVIRKFETIFIAELNRYFVPISTEED